MPKKIRLTDEEERAVQEALRKTRRPEKLRLPVKNKPPTYCLGCGLLIPRELALLNASHCSSDCARKRTPEVVRQAVIESAGHKCQTCGRKVGGIEEARAFLKENLPIGPSVKLAKYKALLPIATCVQIAPGLFCESTVACFCLWCSKEARRKRSLNYPDAVWKVDGKKESDHGKST